jgi:hypothetical protein
MVLTPLPAMRARSAEKPGRASIRSAPLHGRVSEPVNHVEACALGVTFDCEPLPLLGVLALADIGGARRSQIADMLRDLGVSLIAADSPSSFLDDGPTSKVVRQILGAVAEFDKAMVVAKLKGARDRVRRTKGKCEGRKSYAERDGGHELIDMARWLRSNAEGRPYSLRKVAAELAGYGYVTPSGRPYAAAAIASMLTD